MLNAILESFLSILHVGRNVKYGGPVIRWREEKKKDPSFGFATMLTRSMSSSLWLLSGPLLDM